MSRTQISEGDKVRVRRYRIATDGTSEQVGDWTGIVLSAAYHQGTLTGIELTGAGCLGIGDLSLGREGAGRTVVERITDEAGES
jgi:hypothetical protein